MQSIIGLYFYLFIVTCLELHKVTKYLQMDLQKYKNQFWTRSKTQFEKPSAKNQSRPPLLLPEPKIEKIWENHQMFFCQETMAKPTSKKTFRKSSKFFNTRITRNPQGIILIIGGSRGDPHVAPIGGWSVWLLASKTSSCRIRAKARLVCRAFSDWSWSDLGSPLCCK